MNIFYLDECPVKAAQAMCDQHVVKMVLETGQLLCSAHNLLDGEKPGLYKTTHANHPSAKWARSGFEQYSWLFEHFVALSEEYQHRYNRVHGTYNKLADMLEACPQNIPDGDFLPAPLAMPDEYKCSNHVLSYQTYYRKDKQFGQWRNGRSKPAWMKEEVG